MSWAGNNFVYAIFELVDRIEGNGVRTVVVVDASRFARDLVAKNLGCSC
jgi:hypothetical protein